MAITLDGTNGIGAPGTETFGDGTALGGATNPIVSMARAANNYVQSYIVNNTNGTSASADFVAYPSNGNDSHGWVDVGITSEIYADATYTVTGPNEAYLFGSAPSGSGATGNLVLATDNTGTDNSIQFYTGGFTQAKGAYKMQLTSTALNLNVAVVNPTITNYVETPYSANSSTAITLDLANGTVQIITLTGSPTITMPTAVSGKSFMLLLKTGAGSYTVTWSSVQWPSGTAPTLTSAASKMDKFVFTSDGTYWYGSVAGQNYSA